MIKFIFLFYVIFSETHFFSKFTAKHKLNFIIFYWSRVQVQLMNTYENENYDHNFIIEDFREKNRNFRNRTI